MRAGSEALNVIRHWEAIVRLEKSELQVQARVSEIDRQLSSLRFLVVAIKWLLLPGMLLAFFLVLLVLRGLDIGPAANVLGSLLTVLAAAAGVVANLRTSRERIGELEEERSMLVAQRSTPGSAALPHAPLDPPSRLD